MKKLIAILLFLIGCGPMAMAQSWNGTGAANLQRIISGSDTNYRNNMGALGFVYWYSKPQIDAKFATIGTNFIQNQTGSPQSNSGFWITNEGVIGSGAQKVVLSPGVVSVFDTGAGTQASLNPNNIGFSDLGPGWEVAYSGGIGNVVGFTKFFGTTQVNSAPSNPTDVVRLTDLSGYSPTLSFNNGITNNSGTVQLGGSSLIQSTTIPLNGNTLTETDAQGGLTIGTGAASLTGGDNGLSNYGAFFADINRAVIAYNSTSGSQAISVTPSSGMLITDGINSRGLYNAGDYESNFVARSLITKQYSDTKYAPLASPALTGTPTAPTATTGTNTTQLATTAFVNSSIGAVTTPTLQAVATAGNTSTVPIGIGVTTPLGMFNTASISTSTIRGVFFQQFSTDANGSKINIDKARGNVSSPTTVLTGDNLAGVNARGYDGTNFLDVTRTLSTAVGTIITGAIPGQYAIQTANSSGTLVTGLTIDQNQNSTFGGNIGIGKTPVATLDLNTTNTGASFNTYSSSNNSNFSLGWSYGTVVSPTIPTATGIIGAINATTYNGTSFMPSAQIRFTNTSIPTSTSTPGNVVIYTTPVGSTSLLPVVTFGSDQTSTFGGFGTFSNGLGTNTNTTNSNFLAVGGNVIASGSANPMLLIPGTTTMQYRVLVNGNISTTLTAGNSLTNFEVGSSPFTTPASGTIPWVIGSTFNSIGTITAGGATVSNTTTAFFNAPVSAGANNYSAYFSGNSTTSINPKIGIAGFTSGVITITPQAAAGTYNFNLPTSAGSSGQVLTSQAGGTTAMTWVTPAPAISAFNDVTGQTAANSSITTFTTPAAGTYEISGYATITATATDVLEMQCTWTDENSVSRTQNFFVPGATSALMSATGAYTFVPFIIRTASGSVITVKTILTTGGGTITYDAGGVIKPAHN